MRTIGFALSLVLLTSGLPAQSTAGLFSAKTLRCEFVLTVAGEMQGDTPTMTTTRRSSELIFDQIDITAGTGRLIGNAAAADVSVIAGDNGITLLELTGAGNLLVTVVHLAKDSLGRFKAVTSRHTAVLGNPIPSQAYGACRAFQ